MANPLNNAGGAVRLSHPRRGFEAFGQRRGSASQRMIPGYRNILGEPRKDSFGIVDKR